MWLYRLGPEKAKRTAVKHLLDTYFEGSPEQIVAALLDDMTLDRAGGHALEGVGLVRGPGWVGELERQRHFAASL